jgi:uncharacterized membrane protein YedE/YeeE
MFEYFRFDTPLNLVLGLVTGIAFGFLLQRGGVTRFRTIVGQFLWTDHTVLRTMLTAVVVGSIGVFAMHQLWDVPLHIKGAALLANGLGGVIFGIGMVVLGYCPGTGVAALGDGSRHAIPGVLGMLVGAAAYAEAYPWIKTHIDSVGTLGRVTLADVTHLSVWVLVVTLAVAAAVLFALLPRRAEG